MNARYYHGLLGGRRMLGPVAVHVEEATVFHEVKHGYLGACAYSCTDL